MILTTKKTLKRCARIGIPRHNATSEGEHVHIGPYAVPILALEAYAGGFSNGADGRFFSVLLRGRRKVPELTKNARCDPLRKPKKGLLGLLFACVSKSCLFLGARATRHGGQHEKRNETRDR